MKTITLLIVIPFLLIDSVSSACDFEAPNDGSVWPQNWLLIRLQDKDCSESATDETKEVPAENPSPIVDLLDMNARVTSLEKRTPSEIKIPNANPDNKKKVIELPRTLKRNFVHFKAAQSLPLMNETTSETQNNESGDSLRPHQYNIEVRKRSYNSGLRGPVHFLASNGTEKGLHEGREKHVDRDLEISKYRMIENREEEHWHDKDWHKEDLQEAYTDGVPAPVESRVRPQFQRDLGNEERNLPFYARTIVQGTNRKEVDEHFAIPSRGFRVDESFKNWVRRN